MGGTLHPPSKHRSSKRREKKVLGIVASAGFDGARLSGDQESLVEFRLISALLEFSGDPDAGLFFVSAHGLRNGILHQMPRTPAVYERKRKCKLESQADPLAKLWRNPPSER